MGHLKYALALALAGCASVPKPPARPADFVRLRQVEPQILQEIRYAGSHNFVGRPVRGYYAAECWLTRPAAEALRRVHRSLRWEKLGLKVFDCYRPQMAVDDFVEWAGNASETARRSEFYPKVPKSRLIPEGYIAAQSGHSRGSTVDLTLVGADGTELFLGTPFDYFDPSAATDSPAIRGEAKKRRQKLRDVMTKNGFKNLPQEWWHYTLEKEPYPNGYFDFAVE